MVGAKNVKFVDRLPSFFCLSKAGFSLINPGSPEKLEKFFPPNAPVRGCDGKLKKLYMELPPSVWPLSIVWARHKTQTSKQEFKRCSIH
jgi:hypothetical protein